MQDALMNLDFAVYTVSKYISHHCLGILKKRQTLKQNLKDLEECMRREYAGSMEKAGFVSIYAERVAIELGFFPEAATSLKVLM